VAEHVSGFDSVWERIPPYLTGETTEFEVEHRTPAGPKTFLFRFIPTDTNEREGFLVYTDITSMKQREKELETQAAAMEASMDGIAILSAEGNYQYVNEAYASVFAMQPEELLGSPWKQVYPVGEADRIERKIVPKVDEHGEWRGETVGMTRDGREVELEITLSKLEDGRVICTNRDITRRKIREERLEAFGNAIEQAGHAIVITEPDGTIRYANPVVQDILGYTPEELYGSKPNLFKSGEHDADFYERMWKTITDGEIWESEIVNRHKDGHLVHIEHTISPIFEGETIEGYVSVFQEIGGEKIRREQLQVLHRILRHNLRNRLTVAAGYADSVLENLDSETARGKLVKIETALEDILELADKSKIAQQRFSTGTEEGGVEETDQSLRAYLEAVPETYPEATVDLDPPEEAIEVPPELTIALDEVIENAVEHNDSEDPMVRIEVAHTDRWLHVIVTDDGPGIPEEETSVLVTGEETPLLHGSGIGLWIAHWSMRNHGGKITLGDRSGGGTEVTLSIPASAEDGR
jgi:PAS domain S-box-containing protein